MENKIQELRKIIINKTGENYGKYLLSDIIINYYDIYKSINDGEILNQEEIKNIRNFHLNEILDRAFDEARDEGLGDLSLKLILMDNAYLKLKSVYEKYYIELSIVLDAYKNKFTAMDEEIYEDIDDLMLDINKHFHSIYHNDNLIKDSMDLIYYLLPKKYTKAKFQNRLEVVLNLMPLDKIDYSRVMDLVIGDCKPLLGLKEDDKILSLDNFIKELKLGLDEKEISFELKRIEEKAYILLDALDKVIITLRKQHRIISSLNAYLLIYGKEKIDYYKYIDIIDDLGAEELDEISLEHYTFFEKMMEDKELAYKDEEMKVIIDEMLIKHRDFDDFSSELFYESKSINIEVDSASDLAIKVSEIVIDKTENKAIRRMRMNLAFLEFPLPNYNLESFIGDIRFFLGNASRSEYAHFRNELFEVLDNSEEW